MSITLALYAAALGSPCFAARQTLDLDRAPHHVLLLLADSSDLEVRWRVAHALNTQRRQAVHDYLATLERLPWLDALPPDWPDRCDLISTYLSLSPPGPNNPPEWPRHREAMRRFCLAELTLAETRTLILSVPSPYHWWSGGALHRWDPATGRGAAEIP